ncbi:MAG: hypothetical protein GY851_21370, partial [bacterium]|nr:hypothetical protein [bacterium]
SYFQIHRQFVESFVDEIDRATMREFVCQWPDGGPAFHVRAHWCDARTALEHTTSLYCRKPPFVPARAAIHPAPGRWGLLLSVVPDPPLSTWLEGARTARAQGTEIEFAQDLGASLRVFHRMGMTMSSYRPDSMLHDADHQNHLLRFYQNRLDLLVLDRTPPANEARQRLAAIQDLLGLTPAANAAMLESYDRCKLRWFQRGRDRW